MTPRSCAAETGPGAAFIQALVNKGNCTPTGTLATVQSTGMASFSKPNLSKLATNFGSNIAWRAASDPGGLAAAAADATGAFSVGLTEPGGRTSLAVDRFAIHSLCYQVVNGQLRCAPRADVLANAHTEVDPQAIFDYLYFHTIPAPRTIYKGIYRLPPAHCAVFESGQLNAQPYWAPQFAESTREPFEALRDELLSLLKTSVADQLDGSKSACFLNGCASSSVVAGMIGMVSGQAAASYSVGFDTVDCDQFEYARIAAKRFGTVHHEQRITPDDLVRRIARVASHYDQPFGNSSALPANYCAAMARADGVTRLLAERGGDAFFGGNTRTSHRRVLGWYGALPAMLNAQHMEPTLGASAAHRSPATHVVASEDIQVRTAPPWRLDTYQLLNRLGMQQVFTPDFMSQVNPTEAPNQQWNTWQQACTDHPEQHCLGDWRQNLAEHELPTVCGTSALAGLGVGFPLLDQRLLDFSLRLPAASKSKGYRLRGFFKEALRDVLPEPILKKRKPAASLPFGQWARQHAGLHKLASDSLQSFGQRGVVRRDFIKTLLNQLLHQHPGYYGEMVWLLMVLEQWLRAHAPHYQASPASA